MSRRLAFLIGNQTFRPDSGLSPLQGPANDLAAVARVLGDPERGGFDVRRFTDNAHHEILPDIEQALSEAATGDFVLIYYSGHGKLDRGGRLCLATADTRQGALTATSIPARELRDLVEQSDCDQVVLLLDCCYSGAVENGLRGDVGGELQVIEDARGFYILTASTGIQPARETTAATGGVTMGRFTAALVDGIESGAADPGRTGKILLSDLRRYLGRTVTGQTPQFFDRRASGDPLISLSPATALLLLDSGVLADLDAEQWHRRQGAVAALVSVLRAGNTPAQGAAKSALQRRLAQERDYMVRAELESALAVAVVASPVAASPLKRAAGLPDAASPLKRETGRPDAAASPVTRETGQPDAAAHFAHGANLEKAGQYVEAAQSYKLGADQGDADAQNNLGELYFYGRGVDQSYAEAARLYKLAADQGNANAQFNLGWLSEKGRSVVQSYDEAARLYRLAADQGSANAQNCLGELYFYGRGVPQSDTEAARLYKLAADQGVASAQYNLGWLYQNGRGVPQSDGEAARLYKLAADQGRASAQYALGWLSEKGRGVPQSDGEAARLYKLAADQGNATAQHGLGWLYENGRGVQQSDAEAARLYKLAADQGDGNAQNNLGELYFYGRGVRQSDTEAARLYRLAADQGNANAQYSLGWLAENGRAMQQSGTEAARLYRLSADQGHANAQYGLGSLYQKGQGVERSEAQAVEWYRKAARQGEAKSQAALRQLGKTW